MTSSLRVNTLSNSTHSRDMADLYNGNAKTVVVYDTLYGDSPYPAQVRYSFGLSSVVDIQVGIAEFYPDKVLSTTLNSRPVLCATSTDYIVGGFGYNGAFYTGSAYRTGYYTTGWAAGIISCNGY